MERGKTPLLSVLIILTMLPEIRSWVVPDFCHAYDCPEFTVANKTDQFEERDYVETLWITVNVSGTSIPDLSVGFGQLDAFCKGHNVEGRTLTVNTWPALITVTQGDAAGAQRAVSVSWFITPGTQLPLALDSSVVVEVRPAGKVYVRTFSGQVSERKAATAVRDLREVLTLAGKSFQVNRHTGAAYDHPWDWQRPHHNEIWLNAV